MPLSKSLDNDSLSFNHFLNKLLLGIVLLFSVLALAQDSARRPASPEVTVFVGAKVYTSPSTPPISDAVILIQNDRILKVGSRGGVKIPKRANRVDCSGQVIVPGLWNTHVHFYKPEWANAGTTSADQLSSQLASMLTKWGFVHVVDTGSFLSNTLALRKRIEAGEVKGPTILTAGEPLYPAGGVPEVVKQLHLPEAANPQQATEWAQKHLADGADILKVFTGSGYSGQVTIMSADIVRAVVTEAHKKGKLVFAHPQNVAGRKAAVEGGVDVLAHTPDPSGDDNAQMIATLKTQNIIVIPTLKLWGVDVKPEDRDRVVNNGVQEIRAINQAGATIMFGTDVGYMDDPDPTEEYRLMARAGMSFPQILASLTTTPAHLFKVGKQTGLIEPGFDADMVFLGGDPSSDITALANVKRAMVRGRTIFAAGN